MAGFMGTERHIKSMPIDVNPLKRLLLSRKVVELLYVVIQGINMKTLKFSNIIRSCRPSFNASFYSFLDH